MLDTLQELVQLPVALYAPDGQHIGLSLHKGGGGIAVLNQAAGHALHGDKAHAGLAALFHQLHLLGTGQVAEGELQGGIQAGVDGLMGHGQTVVGNGDKADLTFLLGLQGGVVQSVLPAGLGAEGGIVELIDVDMVCLQVAQTGLQMGGQLFPGLGVGLGGQVDPVPNIVQSIADFLLAVGIAAGGVKIVHAAVHRPAQQGGSFFLRAALDG